jgi:hypothetical protein
MANEQKAVPIGTRRRRASGELGPSSMCTQAWTGRDLRPRNARVIYFAAVDAQQTIDLAVGMLAEALPRAEPPHPDWSSHAR